MKNDNDCTAAKNPNSNIVPGCDNAAAKECTTAASTINTASTDISSKDTGPSAASMAMVAPILPQLVIGTTTANAGIGAANIVLDDYVAPVIKGFGELYGKVDALKDTSSSKTNLELKIASDKEAIENALNALLKDYKEKNIGVTDTKILAENLKIYQANRDEILKIGTTKQSGGKKIISRTNKSIKQFLNPKITFANMLKNKSKRKRVIKSKSKKRTRY